jgi:hypothetical protein
MAERSFIYCPYCEKQGTQVELLRSNPDAHLYRCPFAHVFDYTTLMSLRPTMIKVEIQEKPNPTDIQAQVFINPELWKRFRERFPNRSNATMVSIMQLTLDDDVIVISGDQARKLKALGIKTGADIVACAENNQTLTDTNQQLVAENNKFYSAIAERMAGAEQ